MLLDRVRCLIDHTVEAILATAKPVVTAMSGQYHQWLWEGWLVVKNTELSTRKDVITAPAATSPGEPVVTHQGRERRLVMPHDGTPDGGSGCPGDSSFQLLAMRLCPSRPASEH